MNNLTDIPEVAAPSVTVFGCGGAGVNMVRKASAHISERGQYRYIDASVANMRAGEDVIIVTSEGVGSGAVRNHNASEISQKIASIPVDDLKLADVNIVTFSLSGGTGSVLGPLLIKEISRRKKLVVAVVIATSQDQKHTENTLATLKTLESITTTNDIYLPIMIFDNKLGQDLVDIGLPTKLERLVDILTLPTAELDKNDRLHWINVPKTTAGAQNGLRLMYVEAGQEGHDQLREMDGKKYFDAEYWPGLNGYIFDSVINIRTIQARHRLQPEARVSYEGIFTTVQNVPMIGIIGSPPKAFDKMITEIENTLQKYKTQSSMKVASVSVGASEIDPETGLVF